MLDFIWSGVSAIKTVSYYILVVSYKTGQFFAYIVQFLFHSFGLAGKQFADLLQVIIEDFHIFALDIFERVIVVFNFVVKAAESCIELICSVNSNARLFCDLISYAVSSTYNHIISCAQKTSNLLVYIASCLKYFLVLLGSGVWFLITLIPLTIVYINVLCTYYFGRIIEEIWTIVKFIFTETTMCIGNIFNFFWDVPVEATLGVLFTTCMIYILSRFYLLMLSVARKLVLKLHGQFKSISTKLKEKLLRKKSAPVVQESKQQTQSVEEGNICLICGDRQKCILMLPCKHVCVCKECFEMIPAYGMRCPLCRTPIRSVMKVYL